MIKSEIYSPAEDSFLLAECTKSYLEKEKDKFNKKEIKILDMGSGSGIQSESLIKQGVLEKNLVLIDLNPNAVNHLKKKFPKSKIMISNLFEKITQKFDLIIFNPPYLPESKFDKGIDTTGGKNGSEIINKFLFQAEKHLEKEGKILILTSNLTKKINWRNYKKKLIGKKRIFFEVLYVWELSI